MNMLTVQHILKPGNISMKFPDRTINKIVTPKLLPRHPALTLLDFFMWGYVEQTIHKHTHQESNDLYE